MGFHEDQMDALRAHFIAEARRMREAINRRKFEQAYYGQWTNSPNCRHKEANWKNGTSMHEFDPKTHICHLCRVHYSDAVKQWRDHLRLNPMAGVMKCPGFVKGPNCPGCSSTMREVRVTLHPVLGPFDWWCNGCKLRVTDVVFDVIKPVHDGAGVL